ncbi:MAG TPA: GlxA family transcriptional regulator [Acetobacteraceae bacterium]|nr:GlxA family transcriptional regulator [Acetobacteraceae bacterium]
MTAPLPRAPGPPARPALSVGFILTRNFTLTAFATFVDALRLAADDGDGSRPIRCRWRVMGAPHQTARSSCRVRVGELEPFEDPLAFDYLVVVGGLLHAGPQLEAEQVGYLKRAATAGVTLIGVCTGSFALCRAGLMDGRRCCVSWFHYRDFIEEFPAIEPVADRLFVIDGDRITCSGGAGVADLAGVLIGRHLGRASAQKTMHIMQIDAPRGAESIQPQPPLAQGQDAAVLNPQVRRAMLAMEQNLCAPLSIEAIATRLAVSTRQLERLFHSATGMRPGAWYRGLRLRYADWLLRHSDRSVTTIALEAGFADCAHFSREYRRIFRQSPTEARRQPPPPATGAVPAFLDHLPPALHAEASQRVFD